MNRLQFLRHLQGLRQPLFTVSEVAAIINKDRSYTYLYLHRLVEAELLERVGRGRYCLPEAHPLAVASHLARPAYISFWSAIRYYNATTQLPLVIFVANTTRSGEHPTMRVEAGYYRVKFVKLKPEQMTGYKRVSFCPHEGFVATPEKAVVDSLLVAGNAPIDDVYELLRNKAIDPAKVVEYARLTNKQAVMKRAGFLLNKAGYEVVPEDFVEGGLSRGRVRLSAIRSLQGIVDKIWNLEINVTFEEGVV